MKYDQAMKEEHSNGKWRIENGNGKTLRVLAMTQQYLAPIVSVLPTSQPVPAAFLPHTEVMA